MKDHFLRLAHYNLWANNRLYEAVAMLDAAAFHAPRSGFFRTIAHTLNHLLVADRIWLSRFNGKGNPPLKLDDMLFDDFHALRAARQIEDAIILDYINDLAEGAFGEILTYPTMDGQINQHILSLVLTHFFNHQTHHRGQVHAMLSDTDVAPPPLDFLYFVRAIEASPSR